MSSYKELIAQREQLEAQLQEAFKEERMNVLDEIVRKMKLHRITLDEVRGPAPAAKVSKVPPKYRDPVTGNEWSGRGKPPNWIKDEPDRSRFLIGD
ncbi:H-NS histone family protein [Paraburkholderia oxyphila]|uniref:H-NS histone family protein n=1 Tax=Paraburkholderia oxyphila TaxID=614212 RepID=UPI0004815677|nr:H-NS histone family protein [Paraburkholderia oxyphila]